MSNPSQSGFADINGLKMYYEIYGQGKPLVLIHGGGSTIQTSFNNIIPYLLKYRRLIAMDLQAHGRTNDRNSDLSFKQDADDVAALLKFLGIQKADFLGFSNGGQTAFEIALRHAGLVDKLIICSAFYKKSATPPQFWDGFDKATLSDMPKSLQSAYLSVNNSQEGLMNMFRRDVQRMKTFEEWSDEQIRSINARTLIMNATMDVGSVEHAVEMHRTIPNSELVILPGFHGGYLGTAESVENGKWDRSYSAAIIEEFLSA